MLLKFSPSSENYKIFKNEKIEKSSVFTIMDDIRVSVVRELQKLVFHNLSVIIPIYKETFDIDITPKTNGLQTHISRRHHMVHRNGFDFEGKKIEINRRMISELIVQTNEIVNFIHTKYNENNK